MLRRFAAGALRRCGLVDPALERRLMANPMLREAHRDRFIEAPEVAGSAFCKRPRRKKFKHFRSSCHRPFAVLVVARAMP
jgi:hypothetical protein